ncbi:gastrula zinc finger protein XlCGF57.1-like [Chrysoperla carnea]|uniref:gastrula zinc finger protein XlCGF57.1-like n=1 Tax=Chrysoperla carnea TaxID=189513 RepID=UPI001D085647|nr:gastrula zinc finger protein XlCGF57.1-like [Chrysoperla carnea]
MNSETISINDFNSICRICLVSRENMTPYSTAQIIHMIEECTSIQEESFHDKFPQQICYNCYWQLKNAYHFKQQYVFSVETLCKVLLKVEENEIIISIRDKLREASKSLFGEKFESDQTISIPDTGATSDNNCIKNEQNTQDFYKIEYDQYSALIENVEKENQEKSDSKTNESTTEDLKHIFEDNDDNQFEDDSNPERQDDDFNETNSEENLEQNKKSLVDILIRKYNIYDLTCNVCNKELSTRATLLRHMDTHNKNRSFKHQCPICNKGFSDRGNLNKHLNRHEGKANYKCEICSKRYYELSALALHNKEKHKIEPFKCTKCSLQFYHQLQLQQHEQTHEQKEFICDICGKIFPHNCKLKDHRSTHTGEKPYSCTLCDKKFRFNYALKAHIKLSHIDPEPPEMCSICGKLVIPKGLRRHLESHDKTAAVKCQFCNKMYRNKYTLRAHIKERHPKDGVTKKYYCKICNKAFGNSGSASKHMTSVHTDVKKHACSICGKRYKLQAHVKQHIQFAHMDLRPFSCTVCNKAFHTKRILRLHMISHTGERPFTCTICGKSFGTKTVLKTHMKVHTK